MNNISHYWLNLFIYIALLLVWDFFCRVGLFETTILPPPLEVFKALFSLFVNGELLEDISVSIWRVAVGFIIASILGIGLGLLTGLSQKAKNLGGPILELLRPIPPVAFVPISILWFGIGNGPAYFLVSFGAFFPFYTNALAGVLSVSPIHRDAALCLGAGRRLMLTDVILPASLPYLMAGLKTGLGTAWFCVIVAELVGAQSGLGYMIQLNRLTLQSENVIAGMIVIGSIGYLMNRTMVYVQSRVTPWKSSSANI
jgi:NitT/TauT family transport system permease protein/sulfonate transport system permease protein